MRGMMEANLVKSLSGAVLNVTVVDSELGKYYTSLVETEDSIQLGPCFALELLSALQFALNFTYRLKTTDTWGSLNTSTGTWNGMISDLLSRAADLALSPSADLPFRWNVVDFNHAVNSEKLNVIFRQPSLRNDKFALAKPFDPNFLLFAMAWLMINAVTVAVLEAFIMKDCRTAVVFRLLICTFKNFWRFVSCLAGLCWTDEDHQCRSKVKAKMSLRLTLLSWSLVGKVICSAYGGRLVSYLSVSTRGYTTFTELAKSSYDFALHNDQGIQLAMQDVSSPIVRQVYSQRRPDISFAGVPHAKPRILQGSFAFITDSFAAIRNIRDDFSLTELCSIGIISLPMDSIRLGTMVPKGYKYRHLIDRQILKCKEVGLNSRWNEKWVPRRPRCDERYSEFESVGFESLMLAYAFYFIGASLSAFVLIFEIMLTFKKPLCNCIQCDRTE